MSVKRVFLVILAGVLCNACATYQSVVYQSNTYTKNKSVYGYLKQGKEDVKYSQVGAYDLYFPEQNQRYPRYQLVYHYVGDYQPEYDYYVAIVRLEQPACTTTASATYDGAELPVAVKCEEQSAISKAQWVQILAESSTRINYVNILLTREQLIKAYESTGKMIISLRADGQSYQVAFPDTYLRNVLATTTNIVKYQMEEKMANSL